MIFNIFIYILVGSKIIIEAYVWALYRVMAGCGKFSPNNACGIRVRKLIKKYGVPGQA